MKIDPKLQTEIVSYLWNDKQNLPQPTKLTVTSPKNVVIAASMARGVILGMERAIEILNNWNKPNKGKVVARTNSNEGK
jgi:hypothetical protein